MEETRRLARKAAQLQCLAEEYRNTARRGAPEAWWLELQASSLDQIAASLLSVGAGRGDRFLAA